VDVVGAQGVDRRQQDVGGAGRGRPLSAHCGPANALAKVHPSGRIPGLIGYGMSQTPAGVTVRSARPEDLPFLLKAVGRLAEFGPPEWRTATELVEGEARAVRRFFALRPAGAIMLVAMGADAEALGFVYLERTRDYFTEETHGHVSIIAVAAHAEGRGVAGTLMRAAETWARGAGYSRLTLTVFDGNRHARAVYERLGYRPETLRYVKLLR